MRQKLLSLLLLCLCGFLTAAAADYSGYYRFKGPRSGKYAVDNGTTFKIGESSSIVKSDLSQVWEIRNVAGDAYVVINAGTGRMLLPQTATQKEHSTNATKCGLFFIKKNGTKFIVSNNADFAGNSCWHEDGSNRIVVWNSTETYSQWTFSKVADADLDDVKASIAGHETAIKKAITDVTKMSVLEMGGIFRLKSRYDHYASEDATKHTVAGQASKKVNDLAQIWIVEKKSGAFYIRNAGSGRYLPDTGGADQALVTVDEPKNYYIKASEAGSDYFTISWKDNYANGTCLHENSKGNIVKWNANTAQNSVPYSDWTIEPVDDEDTDATPEKLRIHLAEMKGVATSLSGTGTYRLVPALYPSRSLTEDGSKNVTTTLTNDRFSQVWRLVVSDDGKTCTMQNVLTGNYVKNSATTSNPYKTQTSSTTAVNFTIGTGGGQYDVYFNFKGASTGFHCASSSNYAVVGWDAADNASQWILYPVEVDAERLAAEQQEVASATELQKNASAINLKLQKYFEDYACTELRGEYLTKTPDELRDEMTADELPAVIQNMAVAILTNTWDAAKDDTYNGYVKRFRIQDVQCYSDNQVWSEITKVGPFGEFTSPTGIQGKTGDYVYIYVAETPKTDSKLRALLAYDTEYRNKGELALKKGLNVWQLPVDGEVCINYVCTNSKKYLKDFPTIRVHIEGGEANGYWDLSRGMDNADWTWLKANMFKGEFLHVKGENTVLNVLREKVAPATKPVEIMKGWDNAFLNLQYCIGHDGQWDGRYNPVVNPRHSYQGNPNWAGYGGSNHTSITNSYLFSYDNFYEGNVWEILHEIGHGCQGPIKMAGTTEVTNNSLAQCVSYLMGRNRSRGNGTDKMVQLFNYEYNGKRGWSWVDYVRYATPHYDASLHTGNHIWYQLFLYFDVMGNCPGFMGRLYDAMRADPIKYTGKDAINGTPARYDEDFWKVAKAAATVSQTDLWDFFEAYGFWKYADEIISTSDDDPATSSTAYKNGNRFIGDYGNYSMKLPVRGNTTDEKRLADLRDYMRSMPNKASNLMFLDDKAEAGKVREDAFVVEIKPTLKGKDLLDYWDLPKYPDYGQYVYFDGTNRAEGVKYTIGTTNYSESFKTDKGGEWDYKVTGRKVTMAGKGILGIKIYDADDKLCWLANNRIFVIPTAIATGLNDGTYHLAVAVTPNKEVRLAPGEVYTASETEEGIEAITLDGTYAEGSIFDLSGRRLHTVGTPGLRIESGKKVIR